MNVLGIDLGAATSKAVLMQDRTLLGYSLMPTGRDVRLAAEKVTRKVLEKAGFPISIADLDYVASTGYGRSAVEFSNKAVPEIICHALGAHHVIPSTRFILDIGGQDAKAMDINAKGDINNFVMNDKCAAGTGRFLEVMANVLEVESVDKLGPLALESSAPCAISSTCTVFAETELILLRAEGRHSKDLIAGVHKAIASRVWTMMAGLNLQPDAVFTGGVAKNIGVKRYLEKNMGMELLVPDEPQIIGALGAALVAQAELAGPH